MSEILVFRSIFIVRWLIAIDQNWPCKILTYPNRPVKPRKWNSRKWKIFFKLIGRYFPSLNSCSVLKSFDVSWGIKNWRRLILMFFWKELFTAHVLKQRKTYLFLTLIIWSKKVIFFTWQGENIWLCLLLSIEFFKSLIDYTFT